MSRSRCLVLLMIDPVAFSIYGLSIRWYGIAWALAYLILLLMPSYKTCESQKLKSIWPDVVSNSLLASIIGGRLGEMLLYQHQRLFADPWLLFRIWEGGMSFHGAFFFIILTLWWMSKREKVSFWDITDAALIHVPLALGIVRLANYINGELCGRVTDTSFGVIHPGCGVLPRFPSQLYEAFGEGLLLWGLMYWLSQYNIKRGMLSAIFVMGYALIRLIIELHFRAPTYDLLETMSNGVLLSILMLISGILMAFSHTHNNSKYRKS